MIYNMDVIRDLEGLKKKKKNMAYISLSYNRRHFINDTVSTTEEIHK